VMKHTLKQGLLALPGIGVSLLPKVACPLCWPAYAGLLGSTGLGFLLSSTHLLSLTAAFLVIALAALGYRARERRGYGPLTVGLAASVAVLTCKFVIEFSAGTYVGIGLLVLASLWNTWPRYAATCLPSCVGSRKISQHIQVKENRNGESKA
jgi:mercuric ion transport protein